MVTDESRKEGIEKRKRCHHAKDQPTRRIEQKREETDQLRSKNPYVVSLPKINRMYEQTLFSGK